MTPGRYHVKRMMGPIAVDIADDIATLCIFDRQWRFQLVNGEAVCLDEHIIEAQKASTAKGLAEKAFRMAEDAERVASRRAV